MAVIRKMMSPIQSGVRCNVEFQKKRKQKMDQSCLSRSACERGAVSHKRVMLRCYFNYFFSFTLPPFQRLGQQGTAAAMQ